MTTSKSPETYADKTPAEKIVAVVVTYNRLDLLPLTLAGIAKGDMKPASVVVVNNASTDATDRYLDSLEYPLPLDIVHLPKNVGGAGGFTVGIDRALVDHRADLVWVMDDDTEPTENTLLESYEAWRNYAPVKSERPAYVASKVEWTDGRDHPMNTMRTMIGAGPERTRRAAAVGARPIRSASFVSVMMDAAVMRRVGLPIAEFFIWNDDFEYTTRLAHHRNAIATPRSVVKHHTKTIGNTNRNPGPRFYNDVRNKLWVFCRRRTLSPAEKLIYSVGTARLWLTTLLYTNDKPTYFRYFLEGVRDSLTSFRPNQEVLDGVYELKLPKLHQTDHQQPTTEFSVLMSTYHRDQAEYLDKALASNTFEQTLAPAEVVLVKDGVLDSDLEAVIHRWQKKCQDENMPDLVVVPLAQNVGLANALNEGLAYCRYELVARADADDISLPHRFATEISEFTQDPNIAVVGSSMFEIAEDGKTESIRYATIGARNIKNVMTRRNPIFHPTVIFRKSAVESVGGYEEVPGAEDYWLWARLSKAGYQFINLKEPLLKYRTGAGVYERRGGLAALKNDVVVQQVLYNGEIIGSIRFVRNLAVRIGYRFIPVQYRQKLFRMIIGKEAR